MAIREFRFTVTPDSIAGSTVSKGGVQGEQNATELIFEISQTLANKLSALVSEGENKTFYYRFDCYDGAGGKYSTVPVMFSPGNDKEFSHLIDRTQTEFGGTIQVYFVITLVDNCGTEETKGNETELDLYAYCVKLMLNSQPSGTETDGEDYESITTLAVSVKQNAKEVAEANAKMQAVLNGTWKFDGGNASNKTEFVVSDEIKDGGTNIVRSGAIKSYVDNESKKLSLEIDTLEKNIEEQNKEISTIKSANAERADYIVEQYTDGIWINRKWKSGISECWGRVDNKYVVTSGETTAGLNYDFEERIVNFPSGLFIDTPIVMATIVDVGTGVATAEVSGDYTSATVCKVTVWGAKAAFGEINVYAVGKYKNSEVTD